MTCCGSRPTSTSISFEQAAAEARRAETPGAYRAALVALRGRAAAGEPLRRLGGRAARGARRAGRGARGGARDARCDGRRSAAPAARQASSFVGRERELAELKALLRGTRLLDARRDGRRRARRGWRSSWPALDPSRSLVRRRRGARRARATHRRARSSPTRSRRRSTSAPCPARTSSTPWPSFSRRARCCWSSTTASTCSRRPRRSSTRCCGRRRGSRSSRRAASRCACPARSCSGSRRSTSRIPSGPCEPERAPPLRGRAAVRGARGGRRAGSSRSTSDNAPTSPESASASTACRSRSSSPPAAWRARSRDDRRAARRPLPRAAQRQPRVADAAADARGDARLEPRPARTGRAHAVSAARRVRRRLRPRGGRERLLRTASSTPVAIADVLGAARREVARRHRRGSSRERRYRLLETVRLYARERLGRGRRDAPSSRDRHARWALALAEAQRGSPRLDRDAANLRAALDTLLERARATRCASVRRAVRRSGCAGSTSTRPQRRFDQALAAAPERTALRARGAARGGGDRLPQRRPRACACAHAEESYALAVEIGDARAEWRALQFLGEFGLASDAADVARPWLERALDARAAEGFAAAEAICVYSLGVVALDPRRPGAGRGARGRSIELFGALGDSPERIPSPVNIAEIRADQPGGRPGLRVVFEDTLQPFVEISCDAAVGYVLANQAGIARARGDLVRARELLDESAARFAASGDDARQGGRARASRVPRARRGRRSRRAPRARRGARAAPRPRRPARRRARARRARTHRHDRRRLPQRGAASGRGARHLPPRRRSLGAREHALANGRPRVRAGTARRRRGGARRKRARCSRPRGGSAGSPTRSPGSPRSRCSAATRAGIGRLLIEARERYAARRRRRRRRGRRGAPARPAR